MENENFMKMINLWNWENVHTWNSWKLLNCRSNEIEYPSSTFSYYKYRNTSNLSHYVFRSTIQNNRILVSNISSSIKMRTLFRWIINPLLFIRYKSYRTTQKFYPFLLHNEMFKLWYEMHILGEWNEHISSRWKFSIKWFPYGLWSIYKWRWKMEIIWIGLGRPMWYE